MSAIHKTIHLNEVDALYINTVLIECELFMQQLSSDGDSILSFDPGSLCNSINDIYEILNP